MMNALAQENLGGSHYLVSRSTIKSHFVNKDSDWLKTRSSAWLDVIITQETWLIMCQTSVAPERDSNHVECVINSQWEQRKQWHWL